MLDITEDAIRKAVTANAFAAAEAYVRAGRVRRVEVDEDIDLITAKVQGTQKKPYSQMIWLNRDKRGGWKVDGECSCPVGFNCKHVAAVLLAHARTEATLEAVVPAGLAGGASAPLVMPGPARVAGRPRAPASGHAELALPVVPHLAEPLAAWLNAIAEDLTVEPDAYPENVSKRLFYVLAPAMPSGHRAATLQVSLAASEVRRDGTINPHFNTPLVTSLLNQTLATKYVRQADRAVLRQLSVFGLEKSAGDPEAVLRAMLATGRARLG
ncbi:MAG TPA: SWIM zinc finger family protein, partial [Acetobacteraceae bacterium]|nr:SWIM zinc finger family protein [Acetobacteraceae bacterium]